jgi:hypothetical protein
LSRSRMRTRTTLRFSLFTYSQKRALEWWIAARYLEDQAKSLQDQSKRDVKAVWTV